MTMQSKKFYESLGKSKLKEPRERLDPKNAFLIKRYSLSGKKILDLGCGKGDLSYEFAKRKNEVVAIDGSESMLDYAKTRNSHPNIQYVLLDIEELKLKQKFDLILAINSLVHIKTLGPIFVKIHKLLKKDLKFILCFPHPLQDIEDINNYSKEKIIRTETKYGVVKQYYRPIEFYINNLIQSNFRLTKAYEFPARKPDFFIVESQ